MKEERIDILENDILGDYPGMLDILLIDRTTKKNIFWATKDYEDCGPAYSYFSPISPELITGSNGYIIRPRVDKEKHLQSARARDMAEVFTPAWICNAQNNLIDEAWFGAKDVFNREYRSVNGKPSWITTAGNISFPAGKTWIDYVKDTRLEITCGEAPYITSRYDVTTGEPISVKNRIGLLDRKLRVISENQNTTDGWLKAAQYAYKNTYAFEWQGDNLLLAREAMLLTFIDNYREKFGKEPLLKSIKFIAYIISWNVWQMDGLKGVVPNSCKSVVYERANIFGEKSSVIEPCPGCVDNDIRRHTNGIQCIIKDWGKKNPATKLMGKPIRFIDVLDKKTDFV